MRSWVHKVLFFRVFRVFRGLDVRANTYFAPALLTLLTFTAVPDLANLIVV